MAYLDKHSTLDPVMVSVVSSNPTGGNFLKNFKLLDVNFGLKCKCDLIVKNSNRRHKAACNCLCAIFGAMFDCKDSVQRPKQFLLKCLKPFGTITRKET